jgi:hypothetical protein
MTSEATRILQKVEKPFVGVAQQVGKVTRTIAKGASSKVVVSPHFLTRLGGTNKSAPTESSSSSGHSEVLPALPPDERLNEKMQILLQKTLHGITMSDFYTTCWSEGEFYKEWLERDGKHDIVVGDWEIDNVDGFVGTWDQETYSQRRVVTYMYDREPGTLGYSLGKPVVLCTQTQYFDRRHDNDRSVIALTVAMDGEVCADAFIVHIRGVATRLAGTEDGLQLDFGAFCQFTKQVLLASQIRNITKDATTEMLLVLVDQVKAACNATEGVNNLTADPTANTPEIGAKSSSAGQD